jgi:hypothetical protein
MNRDQVNVSDIDIDENQSDCDNSELQDNPNLSFSEYKKDINDKLENKKRAIQQIYHFNKVFNEEAIRAKFESKHLEDVDELKTNYEKLKRKKMEELKQLSVKKFEESKSALSNLNNEENFKIEKSKKVFLEAEKEVQNLKRKIEDLKSNQNSNSKNKYEDEIKKVENNFNSELKQVANSLETELKIKREKIKSFYYNKKIDFENSLRQGKRAILTEDSLKEKKENMLKSHQHKLENFKANFKPQLLRSKEKDTQSLLDIHKLTLDKLKDNFNNMEAFYEQQKQVFRTEQGLIFINNLLNKIKSISDSKNSIFKNLLDFNQFNLKKKIKEIENNKDLLNFTNREVIMAKVIDYLSVISYESIYEYLSSELLVDREIINTESEIIVKDFEKMFSNFVRKVELNLLISSPNFNF